MSSALLVYIKCLEQRKSDPNVVGASDENLEEKLYLNQYFKHRFT